MRFIIIGASGTIGWQLYGDAVRREIPVIGTYFSRKRPGLIKFNMIDDHITDIVPDLSANDFVFLLSALPDPNSVFTNPDLSNKLNVEAAIKIIDDVFSRNASLFFMSSEFVFDGNDGNYVETAMPNPTTLYGKQKWEIEKYLAGSKGAWCITRTGSTVSYNVSDDCRILKTYKAMISTNADMAFDNIFSLTDVRDTSAILIKMATASVTGVFHVVGTPPLSRTELARLIKQHSIYGDKMSFTEVPFSKIRYPEARPRCSWLSNKKVVDCFHYTFRDSAEIVKQKAALIDDSEIIRVAE